MKRVKRIILLCIILFSTNLNIGAVEKSKADISYVNYITYSGGLLPKEDVSLSLTSADVRIDADMSNLKYIGEISFTGNYTIFNPDDSINLTIGAPFEFYNPKNCTILMNGTSIPYIIISDYLIRDGNESNIWNQYLYERDSPNFPYFGFWVVCNISIPKNTSVELQFEFKTPRFKHENLEGYIDIIYDVGTARLWHGNITEKVDIRIKGKLPQTIYYQRYCFISDTLNGKSYLWDWNDVVIWINYVGVGYYFNFENEHLLLYNSIRITLILSVSLIGLSLIIIKKHRERKMQ